MSDLNLNEKTFFAIDYLVEDYFPEVLVDENGDEIGDFFENFSLERLAKLCEGKRFLVKNQTDGILATQEDFDILEAVAFIEEFPKRYERQGHYTTSRGEMIAPSSIRYEFILVVGEEEDNTQREDVF